MVKITVLKPRFALSRDSAIRLTGLVLDIAKIALRVGRLLNQGFPLRLNQLTNVGVRRKSGVL